MVADRLGDNIARPGQGILDRRDLVVEEGCCQSRRSPARVPVQDQVGQRLQALLAGDAGAGAALGFVGGIRSSSSVRRGSCVDLRRAVLRSACPALRWRPGRSRGARPGRGASPGRSHLAQLFLVQPAGRFLAVAGNKGHGVAGVEQFDGGCTWVGLMAMAAAMSWGSSMTGVLEVWGCCWDCNTSREARDA